MLASKGGEGVEWQTPSSSSLSVPSAKGSTPVLSSPYCLEMGVSLDWWGQAYIRGMGRTECGSCPKCRLVTGGSREETAHCFPGHSQQTPFWKPFSKMCRKKIRALPSSRRLEASQSHLCPRSMYALEPVSRAPTGGPSARSVLQEVKGSR